MSKRRSNKAARDRKGKAKAHKSKEQRKAKQHAVMRGPIENNACTLKLKIGHPDSSLLNEFSPIEAIIDTGATNSAISKEIADKLKLPVVDTIGVRGVHGVRPAPVVIVKIVVEDKGLAVARTITATVQDQLPDNMLFGMDAMKGGVLKVDTNRGTWEWRLTGL